MSTREASHAGSWYTNDPDELSTELDNNLARVPDTLDDDDLPISGARAIIAPHAGYSYSGPCAAWAYKALDLQNTKRVFVLGPSHYLPLSGCALTGFAEYDTPFGGLAVDRETINKLMQTGRFRQMPRDYDVEEHSLEMHLPYLWKRLEQTHDGDSSKFPSIVPIVVGSVSAAQEKAFGDILAPYLKDPENAFIISSDFCHWGRRYKYRPLLYDGKLQNQDVDPSFTLKVSTGVLERLTVDNPPIHEIIKTLDDISLDAVQSGVHDNFYKNCRETGNSVCGRHPIGIVMAAMETAAEDGLPDEKGRFKVIHYDRSNLVNNPGEFSVSYVAAYAIM
ncbi:MEMO1 family [Diplogelasinospora grovesii]|uniref:MEMO1 family n=1 Tax=Diplogelasinospora grovesii TaxID=303347 RepID=A0AAN6MYJ3_9PEZI|nr:MEMO1 family [Diplogelasinospora grovesii]